MTIENLQIRGVGSNEKLDIEFSPQVTCIIGRSYIGKSWAIRALRWVALNKPTGTSLINWDSDIAKTRLSIDDEKITRIRSKSKNLYKLKGKKQPYVSFGNSVPDKIKKILNLSDINFQGQHSTKDNRIPFWFCESAPEVSRQLNSIVNLDLIDSTLSNIASMIRTTSTEISLTEESLEDALEKKRDLVYVTKLNDDLEYLEKLQKQYNENTLKHSTIDEKIKLVEKYMYARENAANRVLHVKNLMLTANECIELTQKYEKIDSLIETIKNKERRKCQNMANLKDLQKELTKVMKERCPLCGRKTS